MSEGRERKREREANIENDIRERTSNNSYTETRRQCGSSPKHNSAGGKIRFSLLLSPECQRRHELVTLGGGGTGKSRTERVLEIATSQEMGGEEGKAIWWSREGVQGVGDGRGQREEGEKMGGGGIAVQKRRRESETERDCKSRDETRQAETSQESKRSTQRPGTRRAAPKLLFWAVFFLMVSVRDSIRNCPEALNWDPLFLNLNQFMELAVSSPVQWNVGRTTCKISQIMRVSKFNQRHVVISLALCIN